MLTQIISAALSGVKLGLCPIGLVIIGALFTYRLCESTGSMEKIRHALTSISEDPVIIILLVVWGFGNFMEGIAGFGTAVAIPAAILAGIGIKPIRAVVLCLIANTAATAFGSVGVPAITLANTANLDVRNLVSFSTNAITLIFVVTPFLLVAYATGMRGVKRYFLMTSLVSLAFALPAYFIAIYWGPELPAIIGGISAMVIVVITHKLPTNVSCKSLALAAAPFISVIVYLAIYALALPQYVKAHLTPGAIILIAGAIGGLFQRVSFLDMFKVLLTTLHKSMRALIIICSILALARILDSIGAISILANAVVSLMGRSYAFAATALGAFGGTLTGSGTSSNVLFGALQHDAAIKLGFNEYALAAANLLGSGIGKMICPQSIAIGMAAVGIKGCEKEIIKDACKYFAGVLILASLTCALMAIANA